jgi:uncharacterized protein involved in exopolysaccharide biosynthesis
MTKNLADDLQRTARQAMTGLSPSAQGEESGGLPFRRLLAAVFRARYLVFATTLFGILIGSFLALTTPNTYVSEGKFVFSGTGAEAIGVDPTRATATSQETIATTATYILSSNDLLMKVVERLTPARILEPYQPGTGNDSGAKGWFYRIQRDYNATKDLEATPEEALKRLLRTISIDRPRATNVLVATCTANNPILAQEIMSVFMQEAVQYHIKQYEDESAYVEAEKRFRETNIALEKARLDMRDFLDRKARVSEFDAEKERLQLADAAAATSLSEVRNDATIKRDLLQKLTKRLDVDKDIPKQTTEKRPADTTSNVMRGYEEAYSRALLELVRLEGNLANPDDADIAAKRKEISDIEQSMQKLREKARLAPEEDFRVANPDYTNAMQERARLSLEVLQLEAQLQFAENIARESRANLKALVDLEPEFAKKRDDLLAAEDTAKTASITWNAALEKKALGLGKFSTLRDLQAATFPLEKQGPNRSKLLIGAFFGGLFFGLAIVILRALPDNVVRTRDDLEKLEGLAVIGVMPRLDGGNLRRHVALREQGW